MSIININHCTKLVQQMMPNTFKKLEKFGALKAAILSTSNSGVSTEIIKQGSGGTLPKIQLTYAPKNCSEAVAGAIELCDTTPTCSGLEETVMVDEITQWSMTDCLDLNQIKSLCNKETTYTQLLQTKLKNMAYAIFKKTNQDLLNKMTDCIGLHIDNTDIKKISLFAMGGSGGLNMGQYALMTQFMEEAGIDEPILIGGRSLAMFQKLTAINTGNQLNGVSTSSVFNGVTTFQDDTIDETYPTTASNIIALQNGQFLYLPYSDNAQILMNTYADLDDNGLARILNEKVNSLQNELYMTASIPVMDMEGNAGTILVDVNILYKCKKWNLVMTHSYATHCIPTENCKNDNLSGMVRFQLCEMAEIECPTPAPVVTVTFLKCLSNTDACYPYTVEAVTLNGNIYQLNAPVVIADFNDLTAVFNGVTMGTSFTTVGANIETTLNVSSATFGSAIDPKAHAIIVGANGVAC